MLLHQLAADEVIFTILCFGPSRQRACFLSIIIRWRFPCGHPAAASSRAEPPAADRRQDGHRMYVANGAKPDAFRFCSLPASIDCGSVRKRSLFFFSSGIRDTVIVEERSDAETSEAGPEESEPDRDASGTAAASSNSDDQPAAPGTCPRPTVTGQRPKLAVPLPQSGKM